MAEASYVLGTQDEEIARLGLQHQVWRSRVLDTWAAAGFTKGQTIVDLGCGPGYATLDLAEIVGASGRVIAIDRSRRFLDALEQSALERGISHIETLEGDAVAARVHRLRRAAAGESWLAHPGSSPRDSTGLRRPRSLTACADDYARRTGSCRAETYFSTLTSAVPV
jgi:SAM-dependent methyltransferase